ncbi:DUF732 domain-containing protein [Nocardia sp. NPDC059239]|uniref:DUF732 domain-containing protein n=1 Tax=Nocardia sp. NPDC059239 TaxID=3346785 RepID=UPI00367BB18C
MRRWPAKSADAAATATKTAAPSSAFPAARAAKGSDTDQAYVDALRAAGIGRSRASDDQLKTDGLATCMELRTASDWVITIAVRMTRSPFNLTQHEADMVVIHAVKDICPQFQSRVDNPWRSDGPGLDRGPRWDFDQPQPRGHPFAGVPG